MTTTLTTYLTNLQEKLSQLDKMRDNLVLLREARDAAQDKLHEANSLPAFEQAQSALTNAIEDLDDINWDIELKTINIIRELAAVALAAEKVSKERRTLAHITAREDLDLALAALAEKVRGV